MSRQFNELIRRFNEFKDRFGEDDPLVSQWRTEIDMREALEFNASDTALAPDRSVGRAEKVVFRNAALERLLSRL
ncbi:MAG: hypothetical protein A3F78_12450 [Burkholderiales bacterium RIFCSPLOWO2_12_FULL_61_40]|nr:MAG: hypothetical protein A3F78_12450 [Burkholderiales bacterium RIFCSPLOWO2_12_FULL_61_40]